MPKERQMAQNTRRSTTRGDNIKAALQAKGVEKTVELRQLSLYIDNQDRLTKDDSKQSPLRNSMLASEGASESSAKVSGRKKNLKRMPRPAMATPGLTSESLAIRHKSF